METKRLIVALDVPSEAEALRLANELKDEVAFMKVGLELLSSVGPSIVQKLHDLGYRVFYDGKFKDIPTMGERYSQTEQIGARKNKEPCPLLRKTGSSTIFANFV